MGTHAMVAEPQAPVTDEKRQLILDQLERMLANPLFKNSKRYPSLLRYVVEHALEDPTSHVKERTLGIEVFGRDPDYDTSLDPVVRTTAGEIRKRIAQYYHEPGHESEMRIDLHSGSYLPEFRMPANAITAIAEPVPVIPVPVAPPTPALETATPHRRPWWMFAAAALLFVCVGSLAAWLRPWAQPTAIDRFWAPMFESGSPALLVIGQPGLELSQANPVTDESKISLRDLYNMGKHNVSLSDAVTMTRLAEVFDLRSKPYRIRGERNTSFADLRGGPAVLVGAFNNDWTLRVTDPLRFRFVQHRPSFGIEDHDNPGSPWNVDISQPYVSIPEDYAVITRVKDPTTGRMVVIAAGVAYWGTIAAGEFLTDPSFLEDFAKSAPADWYKKNLQIVIATKVIAGNSGPPYVLAKHFW